MSIWLQKNGEKRRNILNNEIIKYTQYIILSSHIRVDLTYRYEVHLYIRERCENNKPCI